jgi:undecaprenyl diphosphate synthase
MKFWQKKKKTYLRSDTGQPSLPQHVAVIMDGNGRWAQKRHMPRIMGHQQGVKSVRSIVTQCRKKNIQSLTLFAFSSENWQRPRKEVNFLMELFFKVLEEEVKELDKNNIRLKVIGDRTPFSPKLKTQINAAEEKTATKSKLTLYIAANYGGRADIVSGVKKIAEKINKGEINTQDINESLFNDQLALSETTAPDLLIRTGGDIRISNFLLWQFAYTELYFTPTLWPDFDDSAFDLALQDYISRQRRFGKIKE